MICKILRFMLPEVVTECDSQEDPVEISCQDWTIDEFGETNNCELELHDALPWDTLKLGRMAQGEEKAVSSRKISLILSTTSANFQVDSISGTCET
jgi:hypothetical protein